ncbi:MAG: ABC transporter ATP-binding protein [Lachnospiraceae bacterium]
MEDKLRIHNLTKKFGEKTILHEISLELAEGETVVIMGKSGSGKTTLLRILAGLDVDWEGEIYLNSQKMTKDLLPHERGMAMVFQEATLWNHMTVFQNIAFGMKKRDKRKIRELAEQLKIEELLQRYPGEVSGGQAGRVSLARALAAEREILLLDEPLANLDEETKQIGLSVLKKYAAEGKTMIYVTHSKQEAMSLKGRTVFMESGQLIELNMSSAD